MTTAVMPLVLVGLLHPLSLSFISRCEWLCGAVRVDIVRAALPSCDFECQLNGQIMQLTNESFSSSLSVVCCVRTAGQPHTKLTIQPAGQHTPTVRERNAYLPPNNHQRRQTQHSGDSLADDLSASILLLSAISPTLRLHASTTTVHVHTSPSASPVNTHSFAQ